MTKKPKSKKPFTILAEPMNQAQVAEWWVFAGGTVGIVVGLLVDQLAVSLLMGVAFGFTLAMIHRAFGKK